MYNEGLETMPMGEFWLLAVGLLGVMVSILECMKGE